MSSIGTPLGSQSRAGSRDDLDDPDPRDNSPAKAPSVAGSEPKGELKTMGDQGPQDYEAWKTGRGKMKGKKKGGDGEPEVQMMRNTSRFQNMDKDIDFQVLVFF